jgi:hypothetical protein
MFFTEIDALKEIAKLHKEANTIVTCEARATADRKNMATTRARAFEEAGMWLMMENAELRTGQPQQMPTRTQVLEKFAALVGV